MSDLIERQKALEALANLTCFGIEEIKIYCDSSVADSEGWLGGIRDAVTELETLPSAEISERTAKVTQVERKSVTLFVWKCENCGQYMHKTSWSRPVNYCSHCGSKLDWSGNE